MIAIIINSISIAIIIIIITIAFRIIIAAIQYHYYYYYYRSNLLFYYYATFLRLRRECHIQNLLETSCNMDQFLSTSDAILRVSDQFKVLTYLGGGPCP
jgi:hypothetical protein